MQPHNRKLQPTSARRGNTILPDQVDNLLQDQVFLWGSKSDWKFICNKAADILVNTIPTARFDIGIHSLQSGIFCHTASGCLGNIIQDQGEVYDVTHHALNILLAVMQEAESLGDAFTRPLTSLDIHRKPNLRTCPRIRPC